MFALKFVVLVATVAWGQCRHIAALPEPGNAIVMARYIIHNTDWVSIATISTQKNITDYPFVSLKSMSDGPADNSTGVPYLYLTEMDVTGRDLMTDRRCSIMATLAATDFCKSKSYDPQDPRCAKVYITGKIVKIDKESPEHTFGLRALYARHPAMKSWPTDHDFYVAKVDIEQILVLEFFGGIKYVNVDEYYKANTISSIEIIDIIVNELEVILIN